MGKHQDTLTGAIYDLARRGERDQLLALARALGQASKLCVEIADANEPLAEARSALVLSCAFVASA